MKDAHLTLRVFTSFPASLDDGAVATRTVREFRRIPGLRVIGVGRARS